MFRRSQVIIFLRTCNSKRLLNSRTATENDKFHTRRPPKSEPPKTQGRRWTGCPSRPSLSSLSTVAPVVGRAVDPSARTQKDVATAQAPVCVCVYTHTHTHIYMYLHIYIYVYTSFSLSLYIYISLSFPFFFSLPLSPFKQLIREPKNGLEHRTQLLSSASGQPQQTTAHLPLQDSLQESSRVVLVT